MNVLLDPIKTFSKKGLYAYLSYTFPIKIVIKLFIATHLPSMGSKQSDSPLYSNTAVHSPGRSLVVWFNSKAAD